MISKTEFLEWKEITVTQAYFEAILERWRTTVEELTTVDPESLRYKQGYIQALVDIKDIDFLEEIT